MTREEAKAYIIRHCNPDYPKGKTEWEQAINIAVDALEQPEIIRCKDCMHKDSYDTDCPIGWSGKEYCNFAERREEGGVNG